MAYFTTLYSGSSGNCGLVRCGQQYLLIDMGKSCRTTLTALKSLGLAVSDCVGILITHEHSDHVSGLDTFLKKHPIPLYGCADTLDTLASRGTIPPAVDAVPVDGQTLEIGDFTVTSFPTSHDVPCCGYRIRTADGHVMALATDLGYLTPVVQDRLMGCDLVALEANYDAFSLHGGPYPYYLKVRIASDRGHLDNKACAAEILDLIQDGCKKFALCHLSQTNNSPELVMTTVYNVLLAAGILPHGIFELPALCLSLAAGLCLCQNINRYIRKNEKGIMKPLLLNILRVTGLVVIPLLVVAAIMESYVTPAVMQLFV